MKTNFKFFGLFVLFSLLMFFDECKKEPYVPDPAEKFLGSYNYDMTVTGMSSLIKTSGSFTIGSTKPSKIYILSSSGLLTNYTVVNDYKIIEDSGQTIDLPISGGGTATFTENSEGILNRNILTIDGTWSKPGYNIVSFNIVAIKK